MVELKMHKVLFISAFHPGARGSIGAGEAICGDNLKKHVNNGSQVDVIVISPATQYENPEIKALCHSYEVINVSKKDYLKGILFNAKYKSFIAPWFFTRVNKSLIKRINNKISHTNYDLVWFDFPSVLGVVKHILHPNIHYFAHDVVSQRTSRSLTKKPINKEIAKVEANLFCKLKKIVAMSHKDKLLLEQMNYKGVIEVADLGVQKVGEVLNGIPIEEVVNKFKDRKNLIFFGYMKRAENHWSIIWFIFFVFLKIRKKNPHIHLWILGLAPRPLLKLIGKCISNVHVAGAVSDPTLAFQKADLSVAPLLYGAGVKIKVLQMLEAGATVVATEVGAEGIESHKKLHIVNKTQFGKKILELLD
ncbi:glycosyltransferase family 4 protein [Salmonella enterica]|nr:glycosyltransferase family 4 protein [Salmonella enterica]